ncbi:MAG: serine/threonine protein kinase [Candidatus Obscuribacterales bacterium]|nr:serine/threonine protein kinase [Candidatus Obscuribacterales bacterium]
MPEETQEAQDTRICLTCSKTFPSDQKRCPFDGVDLVDIAVNEPIPPLDETYDFISARRSRIALIFHLKHKTSGQEVIAKVLSATGNKEREKKRFMRMVELMSAMTHPGVPRVIESASLPDGTPYILLEYRSGVSLGELLKQRGRISILDLCEITCQVCDVLEHAHELGIVHPDLSPGDIIVEESSPHNWNVSVVDFGKGNPLLHSDNRKVQLTEEGDFFGTPEFMAPEILQTKNVDERSNIYSLGCIMYFCLKGRVPIKGPNWFSTLHQHQTMAVSPIYDEPKSKTETEIEEIVFKALEKDPKNRYANMAELKSALLWLSGSLDADLSETKSASLKPRAAAKKKKS